jgi:tetratricopeptide (TPR) repeat protein
MMWKVLISIIFICFSPAQALTQTNSFQELDHLISFGEDLERDKQSLSKVEKALESDGNNYQLLWRVARACYFVGDNISKAEKLRYFERGIAVGQRAIALSPNAVEGHFWLAVNYGGMAGEKGVFKALQLVRKIRSEMEMVLHLNDRYQDGGAYHALGEMDRQLPRIIGGNLKRGITRLEQGVQLAPDNLEMRFALAKAYNEAGRKEDARRQLEEIIGRQVNPAREKADRNVQEKARRLLSKL